MTAAVWNTSDTEGHQMGFKYSMEGFMKYVLINTVVNSKQGFTGLILRSVITIADDNMQINTVHVSQGTIKLMYI